MGTLTSGLPPKERRRVIMLGVGMALVFLIGFALIATQLLQITGLVLAGGLLLLWVAYNMYRELRPGHVVVADDPDTEAVEGPKRSKTFLQAAIQITLADLSMSLDNVLAVAATAREHPAVLFIGLALSVTLMGLAANLVARLVQRFKWIAWIGLLLILYVALTMIWEGAHQVGPVLSGFLRG
jgi:YjbE family integral membrane protein